MAGLFPAVANLAAQFAGDQAGPGEDGMHGIHIDGQPEIRMDGNMNVTVEELNSPIKILLRVLMKVDNSLKLRSLACGHSQ
ncbi:hypothetical protein GOP47_0022692 [Adiantum capillus-veneris]|uniref:Uncharacterized protein n=1 Tax=Adiantum capillus-veneris TaxID=13818 RepID=A0A9D4Z4I4_ADICA|nr:hypothetical protein GOP47_0022692 [Adiantum capillus-veneris]